MQFSKNKAYRYFKQLLIIYELFKQILLQGQGMKIKTIFKNIEFSQVWLTKNFYFGRHPNEGKKMKELVLRLKNRYGF